MHNRLPARRLWGWVMGCLLAGLALAAGGADQPPRAAGWRGVVSGDAPPAFSHEEAGGPNGQGALVIATPGAKNVAGAWKKTVPVKGGAYYKFRALRKMTGARTPRIRALAKIAWRNEQGEKVTIPATKIMNPRMIPSDDDYTAYPLVPRDQGTTDEGWTIVRGIYQAPKGATKARLQVHLRGAPGMKVRWADISLKQVEADPRKVGLAAIHYKPTGDTPAANRRQFAPLIAKAAERGADLVVLGEVLTAIDTDKDATERVPGGPSTKYFSKLAKKHETYIVAGIKEKAGEKQYNTAILVGPEAGYVGKYRKVVPTPHERDYGVSLGTKYPVYDTKIGKIGMMICWDLQYPQVARRLTQNGAEIIAVPIYGGNPHLAAARAIENQTYIVTSTYTDLDWNWMTSAIWGLSGDRLDYAKTKKSIALAEVELNDVKHWHWLGDMRGRTQRERPPMPTQPPRPGRPGQVYDQPAPPQARGARTE